MVEEWWWLAIAIAAAIATAIAAEQLRCARKAGHLAGPRWVLPFLGGAVAMVRDPARFWAEQQAMAERGGSGCGMSWNLLFGRFIVFLSEAELSHRVFANVRPDAFHLVGHPFGKKLFGDNNLIFKFGDEHKELRRELAPLLSLKALSTYVPLQEAAIRRHIAAWLKQQDQLHQEQHHHHHQQQQQQQHEQQQQQPSMNLTMTMGLHRRVTCEAARTRAYERESSTAIAKASLGACKPTLGGGAPPCNSLGACESNTTTASSSPPPNPSSFASSELPSSHESSPVNMVKAGAAAAQWTATRRAVVEMRPLLRDMNLETSQNVFVGPYLTPEARRRFTADYNRFNVGLMSLPIDLPGFAFRAARQAVDRLVSELARCAAAARVHMSASPDAQPRCLMDLWMLEELSSGAAPHDDREIGQHVFDFLFAAQDASTSSLVWLMALLEQHPEVLQKVRDEQQRLRGDSGAAIPAELLREMTYTEMVVKEVLRFRPPATLVPHIASRELPLGGYTVPRGAIVFPSLLAPMLADGGYADPKRFDPERFSAARGEEAAQRRRWLVFGAGPHQCIGQRYALNHLLLFTALIATSAHWERDTSPGCDDIAYAPTIIPRDGCRVRLSRLPPPGVRDGAQRL